MNSENERLLAESVKRALELRDHDAELRAAWPSEDALAELRAARSSLETFAAACRLYADRPCLAGTETLSFAELWRRVRALAGGLLRGGLAAPGDRIGILGFASVDWVIADLACLCLGAVSVPLPTGRADELAEIVRETELRVAFCGSERLAALGAVLPSCPTLTDVIIMDGATVTSESALAELRRVRDVRTLRQVQDRGGEYDLDPAFAPNDPDRLRTLVYTSGSGGRPKGAMFPERTWLEYWRDPARGTLPPLPGIRLAALPLAHIAGRRQLLYSLVTGGVTHFPEQGDMSAFLDDVRRVRPTLMMLVPRVSGMIYQHFLSERLRGAGGEREILERMRNTLLGDRLLLLITGSAPTAPEVDAFLRDCFAVPVLRGYATTEAGVLSFDERVLPGVLSFRLKDVPALGYRTNDAPRPRGELWVKTRSMVPGYYADPEASRALFDADGYLCTHDIVEQRGPDELVWIDRAHDVVKLSHGEFVEPSRLEALYAAGSPFIRQIYVHGDSLRAQVSAVVVPDFEALRGLASADADDTDGVRRLLQAELGRIAEAAALRPHEIPGDFLLENEPFDDRNGFLTQSGKLARQRIRQAYRARLEALDARDPKTLRATPNDVPSGVEIRQIIRPFLRATWRSRELPDDLPLAHALDSIALLETLLACETHFGVALPIDDFRRARDEELTLTRLAALIGEARRTSKPQ